jgi:hypothetical protein
MGGAVNAVKSTFSNPVRAGLGVMTFGTSELANKALGGSLFGKSNTPGVPTIPGSQSPLQILTSTGGAPLLTNIALGADVGTSLMGYFGASGDYGKWFSNLNPADQDAIRGLHDQLTQVQQNTDLRNQAVQNLANDFPNLMAAAIPKYSAMADEATSQMMTKAMDMISAKQAAGGNFSSGATAAAAARAGADIGMDKLKYGTGLALEDFTNKFNASTALQAFQQKMLGGGAAQGASALQMALNRNTGIGEAQANLQAGADNAATQRQQGMFGALGALGGTAIGAMMGGPAGAMAGNSIGGSLASGFSPMMSSPRLNVSGQGFGSSNPYGR